jgi:iron complex transport system permease protein
MHTLARTTHSPLVHRRRRAVLWTLILAAALVTTVVISAALGAARIPVSATASVLLESLGMEANPAVTDSQRQIVRLIRLPRIVAAALVGASLALAGATMQAIFRNPMADPGLVGVSAGGALGAVAAIASGLAAANLLVLPGAAFLGALLATLAVFAFSLRRGASNVAVLLLAGIAVTYLCSAVTSALISFTFDRDTLREMFFWLLGGFDNRGWEHVGLLAPAALLGGAVLLSHGRALNLLALGEEEAHSLGLPVHRTRVVLLIASALVTGAAVAVSGLVGFVGLLVPHLVRLLLRGSDHRLLLPLSALGGALFLVVCDTVARVVLQPSELRVGIVTAFVGAPFFLFQLGRARRLVLLATLAVVGIGCTPVPPATPTTPVPALGEARSPRKAVIVEPRAQVGTFPRTVRDTNGEVVIAARPQRIHTLSVGYDEITLRLVDPARLIAVGTVSVNPDFSNVAAEAARVPNRVGRDAEQIVALQPDLVVASPFANADLLRQLQNAGVPLVVADLVSSADAHADNIRFLAYLYGEEERGEALIRELDARMARLAAVAKRHPSDQRPSAIVLNGGQTIGTAGAGTTEDGVLALAGVRNAAAEAGILGNKDFSLEALPDLNPTFIVVTEANPDKPLLLPRLRAMSALASLPALRDGRVVVIKSSLLTTLSHWNVVGAEQLNQAIYPGELR